MVDSSNDLIHKIASATDLQSVVRTMKAMAASNITQYEQAVTSLKYYSASIQRGLNGYLLQNGPIYPNKSKAKIKATGIIIFGSDQGMVGQFNSKLGQFLQTEISKLPTEKFFFSVGERIHTQLTINNFKVKRNFLLPNTIESVTSLVTDILMELEYQQEHEGIGSFYLVFNRLQSPTSFVPTIRKLLPLDDEWQQQVSIQGWPTKHTPQLLNTAQKTLSALIQEYLFVAIFKACSESLASENSSRLIAMQRAEKNIDELKDTLQQTFHKQRQNAIDTELFDLVSGFEALKT